MSCGQVHNHPSACDFAPSIAHTARVQHTTVTSTSYFSLTRGCIGLTTTLMAGVAPSPPPPKTHFTVPLASPRIPISACNRPDHLDQVGAAQPWSLFAPYALTTLSPLTPADGRPGRALSADSSTFIPETPYLARLIPGPMPDSALRLSFPFRPDRIRSDP